MWRYLGAEPSTTPRRLTLMGCLRVLRMFLTYTRAGVWIVTSMEIGKECSEQTERDRIKTWCESHCCKSQRVAHRLTLNNSIFFERNAVWFFVLLLTINLAVSLTEKFVSCDRRSGPPLWSSDQSSWLQIHRPGFDSRRSDFLRSSESGTESTQPLLGRKSSVSGLESREYGRRDPSRWPRGTLNPQKLALTSWTSGGRLVGIVRSRTEEATEFGCLDGRSEFLMVLRWAPSLEELTEYTSQNVNMSLTQHAMKTWRPWRPWRPFWTSIRWAMSFKQLSLYPPVKGTGRPVDTRAGGPRSGPDVMKTKVRALPVIHSRPAVQFKGSRCTVTTPTLQNSASPAV
jgi:hypothetical protein